MQQQRVINFRILDGDILMFLTVHLGPGKPYRQQSDGALSSHHATHSLKCNRNVKGKNDHSATKQHPLNPSIVEPAGASRAHLMEHDAMNGHSEAHSRNQAMPIQKAPTKSMILMMRKECVILKEYSP